MTVQEEDAVTGSGSGMARRWTVIASGLLILALALVVMYTGPKAFLSPIALVVVSAIGLAALLLQLRFRRDLPEFRSPLWLTSLGVLFAAAALLGDRFRQAQSVLDAMAFGAVGCFGVSGMLILNKLRRRTPSSSPHTPTD
jgi:drug/metabolite transporter (DMT)-like permease